MIAYRVGVLTAKIIVVTFNCINSSILDTFHDTHMVSLPILGARAALVVGAALVVRAAIVVGVALETVQALEAQMLMRHYKGFLE